MTANIAAQDPDRYVDTAKKLCATRLVEYAPFEFLRPQDLIDHAEEENARDVSEGVRVAYVAATRARDLLVVPVLGIGKMSGWLMPLTKGDTIPSTLAYQSWCELREQSIALGAKPTWEVVSPSEIREAPSADAVKVHHHSNREIPCVASIPFGL